MSMHPQFRARGFTLIELMITVGIVAILASIAVSSYSRYVRQANRTDATRTMMQDAQSLQRCYSQNFTYLPAPPCTTTAGTTVSPNNYYNITVAIPNATSYTITAAPAKAPQTADTQCVSFTLNSNGTQAAQDGSGADSTKQCWGATN